MFVKVKCDCRRWLWCDGICWWMFISNSPFESESSMCDVSVEVLAEAWRTFPASPPLEEVEIKCSTFLCLFLSVSTSLSVCVSGVAFDRLFFHSLSSVFCFLTLNFVHCLALHFLICLCFTLSSTITVHFPHHCLSFSSCPFCFSLLLPSHPAEQGDLWCEADIYSCKSFISTVLLLKQWEGSQINKMAERMDLLRVVFSLER